MLVAEHRFTSGEDQAPGIKPAAPTKLYGKLSSIPVVTISLPSCNGCVSPRAVCLNLLVKLTVLLFPSANREFTSSFPACRQPHHQPGCSHQDGYFLARLILSCTAGEMTKIIP